MKPLLVALLLSGCSTLTPARAPTALEAATLAVTATNVALDTAMQLAPATSAAAWEAAWYHRLKLLESAADVVRRGQDVCPVLPDLYSLATSVQCARCTTLITAAKEQLQCP